jgi:hypothetical protein
MKPNPGLPAHNQPPYKTEHRGSNVNILLTCLPVTVELQLLGFLDLGLEDGTDRMSRNVGKEPPI